MAENQSGGNAPNTQKRTRRIVISGMETDEACDLTLRVDQALNDLERAVGMGRLTRRQAREYQNSIFDRLQQFSKEFNDDIRQPLRKLANRQRRKSTGANAERLGVTKGKVGTADEKNSGASDESAGADVDEVSAAASGSA